jgi:hypothetical protein
VTESLAQKIEKNLRFHSQRIARRVRGATWSLAPRPACRPIFVVGCSRAGTTLVYKTLSDSPEIGSLQRETHDFWVELHPLDRKDWDTHGLGPTDASATDRDYVARYFYAWTGRRRWVDKNNQNGLCLGYLRTLFPDAYFVYVKRSPGDNLNSLIEGWGKPEEFATWSDAVPATVNIEGRYRKWCFFLADGWREYLSRPIEDVCAFQYRAINEAILAERSSVAAEQWVEVFYEDFLRDPVATFRRVFEGCGLRFDSRLERHCAGVLGRPYNAFSEIRLDKWKDSPNRARIERVLPQVADVAAAMGYGAS